MNRSEIASQPRSSPIPELRPAGRARHRAMRGVIVTASAFAGFVVEMGVLIALVVATQGASRGLVAWGLAAAAAFAAVVPHARRTTRSAGWRQLSVLASLTSRHGPAWCAQLGSSARKAMVVGAACAALLGGAVCIPTVPTTRRALALLPSTPGLAVEHWTLSTGSRVAVYVYTPTGPAVAARAARRPPVVYLHGGPVRSISLLDHTFLRALAESGYDVYAYEQPGAGRSDLLPLNAYSVQREQADLNAFLTRLHRGRVDVIGFSAGGSLLARALADPATQTHLHRAILAEPGPADGLTAAQNGRRGQPNAATTAGPLPGRRSTTWPRYAAAFGLERLGLLRPDNQLLGQPEALNAFTAADLGTDTATSYCTADAHRIPREDTATNFSFNVAASLAVMDSIRHSPSVAGQLAHSTTPAMLMIAQCSNQVRSWETSLISEDPALDRVQYMPHVGHHMWNGLDNTTARALDVITAYLDDRPAPLPNYPTKTDLPAFNAHQQ